MSTAAQSQRGLVAGAAKGEHSFARASLWPQLAGLGAALLVVIIIATGLGAVAISPATMLGVLLDRLGVSGIVAPWPAAHETILLQLRLPRILLAGLVGAALASAGGAYQGLFRNPLVDPYLMGVAGGAGLGATLALVLPAQLGLPLYGLVPLAAFAGALVTVAIAYSVARVGRALPATGLLLAGVAVASLASSATTFLMAISGEELRAVFAWLMGSFALGSWSKVAAVLPTCSPAKCC